MRKKHWTFGSTKAQVFYHKNEVTWHIRTSPMQRIDYIKYHSSKVKFIYDFLNHKHSTILYIKGRSKEGKKKTTAEAIALAKQDEQIQDIGYSEDSWAFININTAQLKIIHHVYSWDQLLKEPNAVYIAFDRDPYYSSELSSKSS